jgi:hypothetical protein
VVLEVEEVAERMSLTARKEKFREQREEKRDVVKK